MFDSDILKGFKGSLLYTFYDRSIIGFLKIRLDEIDPFINGEFEKSEYVLDKD